jgi:predicted aspartyl protease
VGSLGDDVNGILGQDFLSQFDYTLDYRASRLSWSAGIESRAQVRLTLERVSGRYLVHLPQDGSCQCAVRLVPDSGTNGVVLFAGTAADRLPVGRAMPINVSTIAGSSAAQGIIVHELRVGTARLSRQLAARIERPGADRDDGDGLLPLSLFAQVSFNNREGYMTVRQR